LIDLALQALAITQVLPYSQALHSFTIMPTPMMSRATLQPAAGVSGVGEAVEFEAFCKLPANQGLPPSRLRAMFDELDADHSGTLDEQELAIFAVKIQALFRGKNQRQAMRVSAVKQVCDFEAFCKLPPNKGMKQSDLRAMFEKLDKDRSGALDEQELAKFAIKIQALHRGNRTRHRVRNIKNLDSSKIMLPNGSAGVKWDEL